MKPFSDPTRPLTVLTDVFSRATGFLRRLAARRANAPRKGILDEYVAAPPSAQNAIDALPGWNTALPPEFGLTAGDVHLYSDPRLQWAIDQFGSLKDRRILELGPLEASHTLMLERQGAAAIDAVEANKLSFMRCLVVKELVGLTTARFHLGDFTAWLERPGQRYDFVVASGVLYHMADPIRLVELVAACTDAVFLWTHYVSEAAMPIGDSRRWPFVGPGRVVHRHGIDIRLYDRSYRGAWRSKSFCGGMRDMHCWMERDDLLALLGALGFDDVRVGHDDPDHRFGPSFSVFARRTAAVASAPTDHEEPLSPDPAAPL